MGDKEEIRNTLYPLIISIEENELKKIKDKYNLKRNYRVELLIDIFIAESIKNGNFDKFVEDQHLSEEELIKLLKRNANAKY